MTQGASSARPRPLDGVVVVDLTRVLAGPFCTMTLAQQGARVIKVEVPGRGDDSRAFGPFVKGRSLYFAGVNCGKESIALDLRRSADAAVFERLLDRADVLVENFRPGTLAAFGFPPSRLAERWPRLVYAHVTGFGHTGPLAQRPAYDVVVQAMGGLMSVTGHEGQPPVRVGVSIGDLTAGLYLAFAVAGALNRRAQDGRGCRIDVSMLDCQAALLEADLTGWLNAGVMPRKRGTRNPYIAPFQAFRSADGHFVLAAGNDRLFQELCRVLERPDLAADPRYRTNDDRVRNVDLLEAELETTLATRPTAEWLRILEAAQLPCGPVQSIDQVAAHPQLAQRKMIVEVPDRALGTLRVPGNPVKIDGVPDVPPSCSAPELDADREAIMEWLGIPATEACRAG